MNIIVLWRNGFESMWISDGTEVHKTKLTRSDVVIKYTNYWLCRKKCIIVNRNIPELNQFIVAQIIETGERMQKVNRTNTIINGKIVKYIFK